MNISEKVAYLKGLAEGLALADSSKEGKVLLAMLDVLDEMADSIDGLEFDMDVLSSEVDSLDDEMGLLLEEDFDDEEEDYHHHHHHHGCDCEDDDYEGEIYRATCPACGEEVLLDEEMLDEGEVICPGCHQLLEIDFDGLFDDDSVELELEDHETEI